MSVLLPNSWATYRNCPRKSWQILTTTSQWDMRAKVNQPSSCILGIFSLTKVDLAFTNLFSGCWMLRFGYFLFIVCNVVHIHSRSHTNSLFSPIPSREKKNCMEWKFYIHNSIRGRIFMALRCGISCVWNVHVCNICSPWPMALWSVVITMDDKTHLLIKTTATTKKC